MYCLAYLGLFILTIFLRGITLSALWIWFIVPLGLPTLSLAHALGIGALIGYLTYQYIDDPRDMPTRMLTGMITAVVILIYGKMFHLAM